MTRTPPVFKLKAKTIIKQDPIRIVLATGFFLIFTYILSALNTQLSGAGKVIDQLYERMQSGTFTTFAQLIDGIQVPQVKTTAAILAFVVQLTSLVLTVGFQIYCLRRSRGESIGFRDMLPPFKSAVKILLTMLLTGIITVLGFICLIVPGILLSYRYRMVYYIIADDPDVGVIDCLKRSGQIMKGHKFELFVLDMSFLLWWIATELTALLLPVLDLWVMPYSGISKALFYRSLVETPAPQEPPEEA